MADTKNYLDLDGLRYYNNKVDLKLADKVDKVNGKGLSANDYTSNEKTKLAGVEAGAQVNVIEAISVNGDAQTPTAKVVNISVPTNNNQLINGAGYQNATQVNSAITNALANIHSFEHEIVQTLPQTGVQGTIYLIADSSGTNDSYVEYIYVNNAFEKLGKTSISIDSITNAEIDAMFSQGGD